MLIRLFEAGDRAAVIDLWRRCGLTRPWNDPEKDIARKQAMQPELFFVGILDGAVAATAMAGYDGHRGSVYYLAVDPETQGKGLGRQIMAHVERALEAVGCPKINVMVRSGNADVAGFYQAVGYEENEVAVYGRRLIADA
jgi:ribosomal protein S18 acetylase RimI-like enzyme